MLDTLAHISHQVDIANGLDHFCTIQSPSQKEPLSREVFEQATHALSLIEQVERVDLNEQQTLFLDDAQFVMNDLIIRHQWSQK